MKKITQNLLLLAALLTVATSCSKTPATEIVAPVVTPLPIQIENDGDVANLSYNTDGTIHIIQTSDGAGNIQSTYTFVYENAKLKEVNFGGKWKYTYTGNNLTKVESINPAGQLRQTYQFTYSGNKVVEKIQYLSVVNMTPQFKTTYTYRNDGNVEKAEVFQYVNQSWVEVETMVYNQYDQYVNVNASFEGFPYLPANMFSPNNPVKETWSSAGQANTTVEHAYTYDAQGRTKTKKTTTRFPGLPEMVSETKNLY